MGRRIWGVLGLLQWVWFGFCLPRSWCTCSAPTWTPGSLLTPNTPMAKPSLPSTSSRLRTNQVLQGWPAAALFCSSEISTSEIFFNSFLIQTPQMKTCSASTRAASTHPTTSWSTSATSTACPRSGFVLLLLPSAILPRPALGFLKSCTQFWFLHSLGFAQLMVLLLCRRQEFLLLLNFLPFYCRTPNLNPCWVMSPLK